MKIKHKVDSRVCKKLNITSKPIENKYCEGTVKRILKRKLKVFEVSDM